MQTQKEKEIARISLERYTLENTPQRIMDRYETLMAYAQSHSFDELDNDVVVLDTETTGFSFNHDELIQIAAARIKGEKIVDWYVTFVNPGKEIPDEVAHLTNIHADDVVNAPDPDEALEGLVDFIGDSYVVAHNVGFDRTFVTKRASGEKLKQNVWIDSLDLARIALPRLNSHRLLDLVRAFGGPDSTHRADDDVTATCLVYRVLLAAVAKMPRSLVRLIASFREVSEWNTAVVFKYFALKDEQTSEDELVCKDEQANNRDEQTNKDELVCRGEQGKQDEERKTREAEKFNFRAMRKETVTRAMNEVLNRQKNTDLSAQIKNKREINDEEVKTLRDPDEVCSLNFVEDEKIAQAFETNGLIGSLYDPYEVRDEQQVMAVSINQALRKGENLVIEAGTGVGKSMAYLVPLVYLARENDITVGVATKTNALLDQLMNKELPLLKKATGVTYASLKGFTHYPCNRKIDQLIYQGPQFVENKGQMYDQAPSLAALVSFVEQTDYDDMDGFKADYRALPRYRVTTKSTECLRRKCPYYGKLCFVHGAREFAQYCDVVVTNHSLLFRDMRFEGGLLPPIRYWVIDEAHSAEAEARKAFSEELSSEKIQSLIKRLLSDSARDNVLIKAERSEVAQESQTLLRALLSKARNRAVSFAMAAEEYCMSVKDLLYFDTTRKGRGYEYIDLWLNDEIRQSSHYQGVCECAAQATKTLEKLINAFSDIVAYFEQIEFTSSAQREVAVTALELRELYDSFMSVFLKEQPNRVYSVRLNRSKTQLNDVFVVQPLEVGEELNESLFLETNATIFVSATLAVAKKFDAIEKALGLNQTPYSQANFLQVDSSYDFDTQMRVYVPTDIPEPQEGNYLDTLISFMTDLHLAQQGSILSLFTNRNEMEKSFAGVNPSLKEKGLRAVCQKWSVSVKGLRDDFLRDEHLSLFALKSFWEGFDAPGSTLKGVIIPRLPFGLPTDPLAREREVHDSRAWNHYSLPAAVVEIKQAVGRLIRSSTDTGFVVLADRRLTTKYYGNIFLSSLPSKNISFMTMKEIVEDVKRNAER